MLPPSIFPLPGSVATASLNASYPRSLQHKDSLEQLNLSLEALESGAVQLQSSDPVWPETKLHNRAIGL